jgi:hypothetical protein
MLFQASQAAAGRLVTRKPYPRDQIIFPRKVSHHAGLAALLRPEFAIVPFSGRQPQFQALTSWCESRLPSGLAVVVGAPGVGKTRLVLEFSRRMMARGWRCGLLPPRPDDISSLIRAEPRRSFLYVIDDADRQQLDIDKVLRSLRQHSGDMRFRLIVVGRDAGAWWEPLRVNVGSESPSYDQALAVELKTPQDHELRDRLFSDALSAFSSKLRVRKPEDSTLPDCGQDSILKILATALIIIWDFKSSGKLSRVGEYTASGASVLDRLLDRESALRARHFPVRGATVSPKELLRIMTAACLLQASDHYGSDELIERVSRLTGYDIAGMRHSAKWLSDLYDPDALNASAGSPPASIIENLMITALQSDQKLAASIAAELSTEQAGRLLAALARAYWHPCAGIA